MKLQDAFVAEQGIRVGTWKEIGYLMKNSSNFKFCDASDCKSATNEKGYGSTDTSPTGYSSTWSAMNIATLNDCTANSHWTLVTSQNGDQGGLVLYEATIAGSAADASSDCGVLTPNFYRLNTKTN